MRPTQEEVDCVLGELEAMLALDHVVRSHNELVRRHRIRLDDEPLVVPFESYEALYCELGKVREELEREMRARVMWHRCCVYLAIVLIVLLAIGTWFL
jgi:hypothetical protein